jgi:general secretion pathway protein E
MAATAMPSAADPARTFDEALGERLIAAGKLEQAGLQRALRMCEAGNERLHLMLVKLGLVPEREVAEALAQELELPLAGEADYPDLPLHGDRVSVNFLKEARVLPLAESDDGITVAMADPLDRYTIGAMELFAGKPVLPSVGVPAEIEAALERLYGRGGALGDIVQAVGEAGEFGSEDDVQRLRDLASEAPVIRIVNRLISRAVEGRASDIHIEPFEQQLKVRYRIDGVLQEVDAPPVHLRPAVLSRIKIMARLNIAERRLPQDGRIRLAVRGKDIDLRVATIPTMHGEAVVLRVLDRTSVNLDFHALGFAGESLAAYRAALTRPNGILLVTGPTGSG